MDLFGVCSVIMLKNLFLPDALFQSLSHFAITTGVLRIPLSVLLTKINSAFL